MEYELIRSKRKTLAVQIKPDGSVVVRAPLRYPQREIDRFLWDRADWIRVHREKMLKRQAEKEEHPVNALTDAQLRDLKRRASIAFPE